MKFPFSALGACKTAAVCASLAGALAAPLASAQLSLSGGGSPLAVGGVPSLTPVTSLLNGDLLTSVQKILYGGRNDPFYDVNGVSTSGKNQATS